MTQKNTMKKLYSFLLISLICGLLLVWYSNAMTYTVEGERTQIKIPKNPTNENIVINRWDWDTTPITSCSEDTLSDGVPAYYCQKTYSENKTYTVTIANPDNKLVKIMFLAEANVKSITDFNWFNSLQLSSFSISSREKATKDLITSSLTLFISISN